MVARLETRYAKSGDVHIAYQVNGDGPLDIVLIHGFVSHLDLFGEHPAIARFQSRLASFSRLILFDKRGTGLSDRVSNSELPTLEQRMDDVRAVMDSVGSARAALIGYSEGVPLSALFAATYPERTTALVLYGGYAKWSWSPDYPWAPTHEEHARQLQAIETSWGTESMAKGFLAQRAPSMADDKRELEFQLRFLRQAASPGAALTLRRMNSEIDVRHVLPAIRVPTLVLHRVGDGLTLIEGARYLATRIPDAKLVEQPGIDHLPWFGDTAGLVDEIEEFLTGARHDAEPDRVLATVLFTDIVGSTERAATLGDRRWRDLLDSHRATVRRELTRFRGREVNTTGDGFLATFDGPARAIRCANAIREAAPRLGLEVRTGLHTGECELMGDDVGGLAVHIGARVAALAQPNEVLVSSTVRDLVAGSGLRFEDRGLQTLKGVPEQWRVLAVV